MADEEWQGPSWLYGWLLGACTLLLYGRRVLKPNWTVSHLDRAASLTRLPPSFFAFQRSFLLPFLAAALAFQQHFVWRENRYENYGLKRRDIAFLLAVGHGSALLFGTFVGAVADCVGRKRGCILFGILHLMGCLFSVSSNFHMLCFAHVFLGVATSLFLSTFEAWMVVEHEKMGFKQEWLVATLWVMTVGAAVMGLGSGAVANFLVTIQGFETSSSSVVSAIFTGLSVVLIGTTWAENRTIPRVNIIRSASHALHSLKDRTVLLLGLVQASFGFSVSTFWLLWTPTLVADGRHVQVGSIYTQLMASMILGSIIAACLLSGPWFMHPEKFLPWAFVASAGALFIAAYDYQEVYVLVFVFCVFNICVGIVLPSLARLRSIHLPNDRRAGIMTLYQAPTNIMLWWILFRAARLQPLENSTMFGFCIVALLSSAVCLSYVHRVKRSPPGTSPGHVTLTPTKSVVFPSSTIPS